MNLVADIGNTLIKVAWFEQGEIIENYRFPREDPVDFGNIISRRHADKAIVSSVSTEYPALMNAHATVFKKMILLDHTTPLPLTIKYRTPETLGRDRIAACAGARYLFPGSNLLVIDAGTAITIDFVSANGEYQGGNISPGLQIRFRALHEYTAKLPLMNRDSGYPKFGTDTRTAIAAGVQQGIAYELNGYMDDFAGKYADCKFIITGGDASFFVSELKRTIFAIPELVLKGLNFILEFNT